MARWNLPTNVNWSNPENIINYPNTESGGLLLVWLAIGIYFIVALGVYGTRKDIGLSLALAGFSTFAVMSMFWLAGILSPVYMGVIFAVMVLSFVALWIDKKYNP